VRKAGTAVSASDPRCVPDHHEQQLHFKFLISQRFPRVHFRALVRRGGSFAAKLSSSRTLASFSAASVPLHRGVRFATLNLNDIWCRFRMATHIDLPVQDTMAP
jgi:hypothetical protein